ncbi:RNA polymerase sigma-70 factor [Seonamhaeicola algicola]|uniref:RNA polymerase sigma-70 factor n=1 Tax=Seonamhaeicola algicola TaxID=1719036 RepID=A0A5C7AV91_9FLAO|nr:RNA polymerase sigma-70 factor [Seonamhaeicola algicola]TXE09682.1 RNA polymerase sigma-70 factor [Seonamhaeicola algicola]
MQDLDLIHAIKLDDKNAFEVLFQKYYTNLVNYILVYTQHKPTAEDIVQQVFINIWVKRSELNVTKSVKGYLYTVAHRAYIDFYRSTKRRDAFFDELKEKALRDAIKENKHIVKQRIRKLQQIVETLPPKCKEILELNKLHGLKYQEIAEKLQISVKTVESQMRIAYQRIREGFDNDSTVLVFITDLFT